MVLFICLLAKSSILFFTKKTKRGAVIRMPLSEIVNGIINVSMKNYYKVNVRVIQHNSFA